MIRLSAFVFLLMPACVEQVSAVDSDAETVGEAAPPPGSPILEVTGDCTGDLRFDLGGLTPSSRFFVASSSDSSGGVVPAGSCSGTPWDLSGSVRLIEMWDASPAGTDSFELTVPTDVCHHTVQAVDATTCEVSSAVDLSSISATTDYEIPPASECTVSPLPAGHSGLTWFDRYTTAFGVPIYIAPDVAEADPIHACTIMKEYLDNDEDGIIDDAAVLDSMIAVGAALIMFRTGHDLDTSGLGGSWFHSLWGQDLSGMETDPPAGFDGALEEVLHLINTAGHAQVYPDAFGFSGTSALTEAMDVARGGHFVTIPASYPAAAWYHYDDFTCDYGCMAVEYLYWGLTSKLGAQDAGYRCSMIMAEWELCTPALFESTDLQLDALLSDPAYKMPTILPDGVYDGD